MAVSLPLAVRWIHPVEPLSPVACMQLAPRNPFSVVAVRRTDRASTYLLAQSLHIRLSQLLAGHEALNPAVQCWDRRRFQRSRRHLVSLGDFPNNGVDVHDVAHSRQGRK
jgi:hypothetical protein